MNTAIITIKIKPEEKKSAQKVAQDLGLPLSLIIKEFLKQFVEKKSVTFSLDEKPNGYFLNSLKASREDIRNNRKISFQNGKEALSYLNKMIKDEKSN